MHSDRTLLSAFIGVNVSKRLEAKVRADFDSGSVEPVLSRLAGLQLAGIDTDAGRERVQAAIVLLANGRWSAFQHQATLAETDWRDVLVPSGLGDEDWRERLSERLGASQAS